MKYATAIGHLRRVVQALADDARLAQELGGRLPPVVAAYAFGDLLDAPDRLERTDVARVVNRTASPKAFRPRPLAGPTADRMRPSRSRRPAALTHRRNRRRGHHRGGRRGQAVAARDATAALDVSRHTIVYLADPWSAPAASTWSPPWERSPVPQALARDKGFVDESAAKPAVTEVISA